MITPTEKTFVVGTVRVEGVKRTRDAYIHTFLSDQHALWKSTTLEDVALQAQTVADRLKRLNIFKSVSIKLDTSSNINDRTLDVIFEVEESSTIVAHTGVDVGFNQGSMVSHSTKPFPIP
jgi:outer membrane protein assembly factor BamA